MENERKSRLRDYGHSGLELISTAPMMGVDNVWCSVYSSHRRRLKGLASIIGRQSEVSWVIRSGGAIRWTTRPEKTDGAARCHWGLELRKQ